MEFCSSQNCPLFVMFWDNFWLNLLIFLENVPGQLIISSNKQGYNLGVMKLQIRGISYVKFANLRHFLDPLDYLV